MDVFTILVNLDVLKLVCLVIAGLFIYVGPLLIKKKYLKRTSIAIDEKLENRNSWIFFPDSYNFNEKALLLVVYILSFFIAIVGINL
jgi:hypothetical protein